MVNKGGMEAKLMNSTHAGIYISPKVLSRWKAIVGIKEKNNDSRVWGHQVGRH
jgi:hypothetical protein